MLRRRARRGRRHRRRSAVGRHPSDVGVVAPIEIDRRCAQRRRARRPRLRVDAISAIGVARGGERRSARGSSLRRRRRRHRRSRPRPAVRLRIGASCSIGRSRGARAAATASADDVRCAGWSWLAGRRPTSSRRCGARADASSASRAGRRARARRSRRRHSISSRRSASSTAIAGASSLRRATTSAAAPRLACRRSRRRVVARRRRRRSRRDVDEHRVDVVDALRRQNRSAIVAGAAAPRRASDGGRSPGRVRVAVAVVGRQRRADRSGMARSS